MLGLMLGIMLDLRWTYVGHTLDSAGSMLDLCIGIMLELCRTYVGEKNGEPYPECIFSTYAWAYGGLMLGTLLDYCL